MANNRKAQYAIYKGKGGRNGAVQFNLIPFQSGRKRDDGKEADAGFVLIEAARTTAPDVYDWANKIKFAMDVDDLGKFIVGITKDCDIFHKYDRYNLVKKLNLKYQEYKGEDTWMLSLSQRSNGGDWENTTIPVTANEMAVLNELMRKAICIIRGWDGEPQPPWNDGESSDE